MNANELPLSGFVIEQVYTDYQLLQHKDPGEEHTHGLVEIGWDWRLIEAPEPTFEVRLAASVEPSPERDDYIAAHVVGRFRVIQPSPTVPIVNFVRLQGPAILLPFLRQAISGVTSNSYYGTYYLPMINVIEMMKDFDPTGATGAQQLEKLTKALQSPEGEETSEEGKPKRTARSSKQSSAKRRSQKKPKT